MVLALGISHKTAPVAVREKLAFPQARMASAITDLKEQHNISEALLLSTCNRTEIYCSANEPDYIFDWWQRYCEIGAEHLLPYSYSYQNDDAAKHAMRVASGLDSMVLGEPQILGQLKSAYRVAMEQGSVGRNLGMLFQTSFQVAKHIRTHTQLGTHPVSIAYSAVKLAKNIFSHFEKVTVLLIGAGENIELLAEHLTQLGIANLIIANRTLEKAQELATRFNGQAIRLDEITQYINHADMIMSSTGSTNYILEKEEVESALKQRKRRPIFMVDLAIPRDIDPKLADNEDIYLYTIDDLQNFIDEGKALREQAACQAEIIIEQEVQNFMLWLGSGHVGPTIRSFREQINQLSEQELDKAHQALSNGQDPHQVLNQFAHSLTQKFLHNPTLQLKDAHIKNEHSIVQAAKKLFNLD